MIINLNWHWQRNFTMEYWCQKPFVKRHGMWYEMFALSERNSECKYREPLGLHIKFGSGSSTCYRFKRAVCNTSAVYTLLINTTIFVECDLQLTICLCTELNRNAHPFQETACRNCMVWCESEIRLESSLLNESLFWHLALWSRPFNAARSIPGMTNIVPPALLFIFVACMGSYG